MNVLADAQKKLRSLKGVVSEKEYEILKKEYLELYYKLRQEHERRFYSKLTLSQRKKIHFLILTIYKIKNRLGKFTYEVIKDERIKTDRPIIFALTHVGKFDIELTSEALKDHYYLLSGDYEHIQGIIDAPFIALNGVFYFNENIKEDRKAVTNKMINHLKAGGNLMYFPEGTWNLSPNLPMLPCYWGIVDVAKKSNAIIIPVAADQYGKHFKINIGKNIDMNQYGNSISEKSMAIRDLRDILATLKWEIWESYPVSERSKMTGLEWEEYISARIKEWPYFSEEYIDGLIYKPKDITDRNSVYSPIKKLTPSRKNAFLFNKRLKDDIFK